MKVDETVHLHNVYMQTCMTCFDATNFPFEFGCIFLFEVKQEQITSEVAAVMFGTELKMILSLILAISINLVSITFTVTNSISFV